VLSGVRGPSSLLDGESVDIEPMNVPHRSKIYNLRSPLEEQYAPTIPECLELMEPEEVRGSRIGGAAVTASDGIL
jgi:hypothetical protein